MTERERTIFKDILEAMDRHHAGGDYEDLHIAIEQLRKPVEEPMKIDEAEQAVKEAQVELKKAEEALKIAKVHKNIAEKEFSLDKRGSKFPPGFHFQFVDRNDPLFDDYWKLTFSGVGIEERSWKFKDESEAEVKAREHAWYLFDLARDICTVALLIR